MERPEKIYLTEPIILAGIKVQHTYAGLIYMVDHYKTILAQPLTPQQLKDEHRQYIEKLIENYNIHLQLYEHERANETSLSPVSLPPVPDADRQQEEVPDSMAGIHDNGNASPG